jgi:hypothetical protein
MAGIVQRRRENTKGFKKIEVKVKVKPDKVAKAIII